jgi:uncharacterized protein (DUF2164 family)
MPIEFSDDVRKGLRGSIQGYCGAELDLDIGELQSEKMLEFVINLIGATVYNQAIGDAQAHLQAKLLDMEGDLHETVEHEAR